MIEYIEGIVTDIVRHNDKHNVVTLFTRRNGRMAFLVPVGKSRTGRMRNALFAPMAVVGGGVNLRQGKELYSLRNAEPVKLWHDVYSNPVKSSLLFFLTEFCNRLLRQYPADDKLWNYILNSMEVLEAAAMTRIANFHLAFLIRLLPIVGIEPAVVKWESGDCFDMLSAEMVDRQNPSFLRRRELLSEEESRLIPVLLKMNFRNMHLFRFRREERQEFLEKLLRYYSSHLPLGRDFKTLPVLRELFL